MPIALGALIYGTNARVEWEGSDGGGVPGINGLARPGFVTTDRSTGTQRFDVTRQIQDWASGQTNVGGDITGRGTKGTEFSSFDSGSSARPRSRAVRLRSRDPSEPRVRCPSIVLVLLPPHVTRYAMSASLLALAFVGCAPTADEAGAPATGSFLAVGDTGEPWGPLPQLFEPQLAVGRAMARVHAARPADALVLLGDNFYPDGLRAEELVPRVVENVARPFCAFVAPTPELAAAFDDGCTRTEPPPPLYAVIGNHDVRAPDSGRLQRTTVPGLVANWEVPSSNAPAVRELPGGLSLIFVVSEWPWEAAQEAALANALREARGPWRVVVGHRPPIAGHPRFSELVANAARRSGHVLHAYVAGHVHALGAVPATSAGAPRLTVIAGSGAHTERQTDPEYRIEGADVLVEALGFARVAAIADEAGGKAKHLEVSLLRAPSLPLFSFLGSTVVARYSITLDGRVDRVDENPASPAVNSAR